MSSIRTEFVALDTNEYVFAVWDVPGYEASVELLVNRIESLRIYLPLPDIQELNHILTHQETQRLFRLLGRAADLWEDRLPPQADLVELYQGRGAKKGDARICAYLHVAGIQWLVSENRHFLQEVPELPFTVLTGSQALQQLDYEQLAQDESAEAEALEWAEGTVEDVADDPSE